MDPLSEYFATKHQAFESGYKVDCLVIAREIAAILLDQGKEPYIMMLVRFEQRGENKYYGPIQPVRYRGGVTFTRHYVCCCKDQAFDPIYPEPVNISEYSVTVLGIEIPMQSFISTSEMRGYLARFAKTAVNAQVD